MASDLLEKGHDEFKKENYQRAVELYSEAVLQDPNNEDALVYRAQGYMLLGQRQDAILDLDKVLAQNSRSLNALLLKGNCLYYLQDYQAAQDIFKKGAQLSAKDSAFVPWLVRCEIKLNEGKENGADKTTFVSAAAVAPAPAPSKPKYDWYQTATHVIVALLQKNTKKEDLVLDTQPSMLKLHTKRADGEDLDLEIHLSHPINPDQTVAKIMASKVEVKLKKAEGVQWTKLEGDGQKLNLKLPSPLSAIPDKAGAAAAATTANKYPSSSHYTRNWDQLEQEVKEEEKNEKLEGDAALNKLFQQIYADGNDEVKKAMMKSFSESGGTVLSTNWSEVRKDKVEVKPPDGMEYKSYEK